MIDETRIQLGIKGMEDITGPGGVLDPQVLTAAIKAAVRRTGEMVVSAGVKVVREEYNSRASVIKDATSIARSNGGMESVITIKGRRIPLAEFSPRYSIKHQQLWARGSLRTVARRANAAGVSVLIKRGKPRMQVAQAFMTPGSPHVYMRAWKGGKRVGRYPMWRVYGPSVPFMFNGSKPMAVIRETIKTKGAERLRHEYARRIARKSNGD